VTLTSTAKDGDGNVLQGVVVTYVSRAGHVAIVDQTGLVKAMSSGETFIVAQVRDGRRTVSDSIRVVVFQ
jgi:uncharacterized protein YjdB